MRSATCNNCATPAFARRLSAHADESGQAIPNRRSVGARVTLLYGDEWPAVKMKTLANREEVLVPNEELLGRVKRLQSS